MVNLQFLPKSIKSFSTLLVSDHGDPNRVTSDDTANGIPILQHSVPIDLETQSDYPSKSPLKQRVIPPIWPMTPRTAPSHPRRRWPSNDLNPDDLGLEDEKFMILNGRWPRNGPFPPPTHSARIPAPFYWIYRFPVIPVFDVEKMEIFWFQEPSWIILCWFGMLFFVIWMCSVSVFHDFVHWTDWWILSGVDCTARWAKLSWPDDKTEKVESSGNITG